MSKPFMSNPLISKSFGFVFVALLVAAAIVAWTGPIVAGRHGQTATPVAKATPLPAQASHTFGYAPEFPMNLVSP
jgi:hypothetical protein